MTVTQLLIFTYVISGLSYFTYLFCYETPFIKTIGGLILAIVFLPFSIVFGLLILSVECVCKVRDSVWWNKEL